MKIAYFDTFSGISGDMTLGALVNAGMPFDDLRSELRKLPLGGYEITQRTLMRSMIAAVKIDVILKEERQLEDDRQLEDEPKLEDHPSPHAHPHPHDSSRPHGHPHPHKAGLSNEAEHDQHGVNRSYVDIMELIDGSDLSARVKNLSGKMFLAIAKAEAKVHDTDIEHVHFHEVGAVDSIVDIVGIAICLDRLGVERVYSSPVRTGSGGFVKTQHGLMPVPTPATIEILKGYPTQLTDIPHELATPTGAAVIAALSSGVLTGLEGLSISAVGYGSGGRDIPGTPNLLRVLLADMPAEYEEEEIQLLETNIDDMNPELLPYVIDRCIAEGAYEAFFTSVMMKKGRLGYLLTVLAPLSLSSLLQEIMYAETSTTGIRIQTIRRSKLKREVRTVESSFGSVAVKAIEHAGTIRLAPEYEVCKNIAKERGIPLIEVYRRLETELSAHNTELSAHNSETPAHNSETPAHNSETPAHNSETPAHNSWLSGHNT